MGKGTDFAKGFGTILKKYKHAVWILIIGIGLLLIPSVRKESSVQVPTVEAVKQEPSNYCETMEQRLKVVLSQIQGVGNVEVILTLKQGEVTHYLVDRDCTTSISEEGTSTEETEKAVIISKGSSYDEPIVTGWDFPLFQGALIVCEGGGDAEVKLQLTQAVVALTNLSSHNITILKMK